MEVITSVTRIRSKVKLVIGSETITIPASLYRERPLQEGEPIELEEYEKWLLLHQYRPALEYAVSLLSQRAWAAGELKQRLQRMSYRPQTVEMVLYKLSSNGLLDDADFAKQWVAARANHKLGRTRIAQELRRKSVSQEDAEEALDTLNEEDQLTAAVALARKSLSHAKAGEDPRKTAQRTMAMLARRGYNYELSRKAIRQVLDGADDELE